MAAQTKRETGKGATASGRDAAAPTEEALRPFHEAARKFAEARTSAQERALGSWGQAYLDLQDEARKIEQEALNSVAERNRKFFQAAAQVPEGSFEEALATRSKLQLEYENELRQLTIDTHGKLAELAQRAGEINGEEAIRRLSDQQQEAYRSYVSDLQQAWSQTKDLDPQTMSAIALNILSTLNSCPA